VLLLDKIRTLAKINGWTLAKIERDLGFSNNSISKWIKNKPSADKVKKVAELFNIPVEWFLSEAPLTTENTPSFLLDAFASEDDGTEAGEIHRKFILSKDEEQMVDAYRTLDIRGRAIVLNTIIKEQDISFEKRKGKSTDMNRNNVLSITRNTKTASCLCTVEAEEKIDMDVYDLPASAGIGNYLDDVPFETKSYDASCIPRSAGFGIRISGDSMIPEIEDKEIVWVEPMPKVEDGDIGIFVLEGEAYCKRLKKDHENQRILLVSTNENYPPIPVTEHERIDTIGKVLL
jgi:phage repressor protein C with HTH and peptisase S24 domain